LVEEEGLADVFDLGDCAFEVEGFGEDDFEDLVWGWGVSEEFWFVREREDEETKRGKGRE
jgi:hypothetical protein